MCLDYTRTLFYVYGFQRRFCELGIKILYMTIFGHAVSRWDAVTFMGKMFLVLINIYLVGLYFVSAPVIYMNRK